MDEMLAVDGADVLVSQAGPFAFKARLDGDCGRGYNVGVYLFASESPVRLWRMRMGGKRCVDGREAKATQSRYRCDWRVVHVDWPLVAQLCLPGG